MTTVQQVTVSRRAALMEAEIDGELIGLDVDQGQCFGFNRTATRIWALLEEPRSLETLCDMLSAEFDIAPEACATDLAVFLRELEADGLVTLDADTPPEQ